MDAEQEELKDTESEVSGKESAGAAADISQKKQNESAEEPAPEVEKQLPQISDTPQTIYVDICGAVTSPGVYELPDGSRVCPVSYTHLAVALVRFQEGKPFFVNCYPRVVKSEGSPEAQKLIEELMEPCDSEWRGLGVIPGSGLVLRKEWEAFDARKKYAVPPIQGRPNPACRCGDVLQGKCRPSDCKVFGKVCTPQHPVGACMVSNEGACSAYFMYGN